MNKLLLPPALFFVFCAASAASGQNGARQLDNFDIGGVQVQSARAPAAKPQRKARPLTSFERAHLHAKPTLFNGGASAALLKSPAFKSLDSFTTGNAQFDSLIVESSTRHGVDPVLIYAIMHRESAFKQRAVSHAGARGLMQLMPATAARFGVRNIFDPGQNIEAGTRYMRWLLDRFGGDVRLALAGYNAGEGAVDRYGRRVPPYRETQEYVRRIGERYALMRHPQTARRAPTTAYAPVSSVSQADASVVYERNVYAVKLPDGKLMLVSQ